MLNNNSNGSNFNIFTEVKFTNQTLLIKPQQIIT